MKCFLGKSLPQCQGKAVQFYTITTTDGYTTYRANCELHILPENHILRQWDDESVEFVNEAHIAALLIHEE